MEPDGTVVCVVEKVEPAVNEKGFCPVPVPVVSETLVRPAVTALGTLSQIPVSVVDVFAGKKVLTVSETVPGVVSTICSVAQVPLMTFEGDALDWATVSKLKLTVAACNADEHSTDAENINAAIPLYFCLAMATLLIFLLIILDQIGSVMSELRLFGALLFNKPVQCEYSVHTSCCFMKDIERTHQKHAEISEFLFHKN